MGHSFKQAGRQPSLGSLSGLWSSHRVPRLAPWLQSRDVWLAHHPRGSACAFWSQGALANTSVGTLARSAENPLKKAIRVASSGERVSGARPLRMAHLIASCDDVPGWLFALQSVLVESSRNPQSCLHLVTTVADGSLCFVTSVATIPVS